MRLHLKKFDTQNEYEAYIASEDKVLPNVSFCEDARDVHYNPLTPPYDPYNGHDYVEIGGLKWATMNIGANSITETGLYFQWGDTQGYTADQVGIGEGQKYFGWADYKYSNDNGSVITKYNSTDGKTVLEASDDAAQANWGGQWRMPTEADFNELLTATTNTWVTNYNDSGVNGYLFTSKTDSSKKLFFPACGACFNGSVSNVESNGRLWSSSLHSSSDLYGDSLYFLKQESPSPSPIPSVNPISEECFVNYFNRHFGICVRGVVGLNS